MSFQTSPLQSGNISKYSMYMNINANTGSLREPVNSPAENNKASELGNLQKSNKITECQTCKSRKYVDGSNDPGVSFKSPTSVSPGASFSAVSSHEQEHVTREQAKASREGRRVISQSVKIYIDTCPECGKAYSSGGKTTTVTKGEGQKPDYFMDKMNKFFDGHFGKKVDTYI
ncbi:MAG: hypothetical protein GX236_04225 [Clostridiaceae bacterium]|jgi:hypothetical protein|nr:hypothetical protein [Clostridiaceae bacterium]